MRDTRTDGKVVRRILARIDCELNFFAGLKNGHPRRAREHLLRNLTTRQTVASPQTRIKRHSLL